MKRMVLILFFGIISCSDPLLYTNEDLNTGWEFWLDGTPENIQEVFLPHTPRLEPYLVNDQWQGICWYRKNIKIPGERHVLVRFEGAMNVAEAWVNGHYAGKHMGGYLPFVIDVTAILKKNGDSSSRAELKIRLDNYDNPVTGPKPLELLDFNMYGGLYREARIMYKSSLHITDAILENTPAGGGVLVTYPAFSSEKVVMNVQTHIRYAPLANEEPDRRVFTVKQTLYAGDSVGAVSQQDYTLDKNCSLTVTDTLTVAKPFLWSPDHPFCYDLVTEVLETERNEKQVVKDSRKTTVGLRQVVFKEKDLYVNGQKMFLKGVNRHQEYPYVGYAMPGNAQWRDAVKIKEAGFDAVRLSHYPHSPEFMEACNRLGLFVLDAIPGWQYFSEDPEFQSQVIQTARDMIRRDRNYPCVLAWEVSLNESWMSEDFIDRIIQASRNEMPVPIYTAGWQEYGYDILLQARQHRLDHSLAHTRKPYIVSEYGDWEYYAMNAGFSQENWENLMPQERSSRQLREYGQKRMLQQATNIQEAHNSNYGVNACGDNYWVMFDYNRGYAEDLEASGIMSLERLPKFSYYFFRSQGEPEGNPFVYIADYWEKQDVPDRYVRVFSNADHVELWLNGNLVEKRMPDKDAFSENLPHPPFTFKVPEYKEGWLKAVAYSASGVCIADSVHTPGKPVALEWWLDTGGIAPAPNDLLFVYAKAVDGQGNPVPSASGDVVFDLEGKGMRLIGEGPGGIPMESDRITAPLRAGTAFVLLRLLPQWEGDNPQISVTLKL
ncbi:MAG: glycoside hydrolase family 2 TIM barrel-domain containing protein [Bacteroidales bacterium]|nr:glycoside hydrolase family 2 TIM barrel-domain containing protein [Bacteroidales bacterium]